MSVVPPKVMPLPLRSALPFATLALVAAGCGSTAAERRLGTAEEVRALVADGRFEEALARAETLAAASEGDESLEIARRDAEVALLLERGRRLSFADEDEAALEQVEAAARLDPSSPYIPLWRKRIVDKLGDRWFQRGRDAHAKGDYEAAGEGYRRAIQYVPDHSLANFQLRELEQSLAWRSAQSGVYYSGGVRAFVDAELSQARTLFESSRKYNDGDPSRTERRIDEVEREIARERKFLAEQQAAAGHWRSASREIEAALGLDPELEGGKALAEEYAREALVAGQLRDAELASLRGEDDEARELLQAARASTKHQVALVDAELVKVDEHEASSLYQAGLDLEYDFRYEEAAERYRALLAKRTFFKDARARLDTLDDTIQRAAELYGRVAKAKTDTERRELLRQIELIWPEYRDVRTRLAALGTAN